MWWWWWLGCAEAPCGDVGAPADRAENVLIVVLDDVGVDQLGAWGIGPRPARTPTVDCLCDRGLRFTQTWATPICSPSRAALLTGQYPSRYGLGGILTSSDVAYEVPTDLDGLGHLGRRAGLATGFFGKWHLATPDQPGALDHPNRAGFDRFAGSLANLNVSHQGPGALTYAEGERVVDGVPRHTREYPTTAVVDDALDFVADVGEPWLVVLSFHAGHVPLHRPPPHLLDAPLVDGGSPDATNYLAMIEAADHELGRFLRRVGDDTLARTTVVFTTDNGSKRSFIAVDGDGKGSLTAAGQRVPTVWAGPGVPVGVTDAVTHLVDVVPTVADALGVEVAGVDGRSWGPLAADPAAEVHDVVHAALFREVGGAPVGNLRSAVRDATHKLRVDASGEALLRVGPDRLDEERVEPAAYTDADALAYARLRAALTAFDASFVEGPVD